MKKIAETTIFNNIMKEMSNKGVIWDVSASEDIIKLAFEAVSAYLGQIKSKTEDKGIKFSDNKGNFHFGAYVSFIPRKEDENRGSYSLSFTFNEDDMKNVPSCVEINNQLFRHVLAGIASRNYHLYFEADPNEDWVSVALITCLDGIKQYLEMNISNDPSIELDEFFSATAELDGDKIYVAITPSAILKQHIKDDASLEVVE